jgi:hypothetical protein
MPAGRREQTLHGKEAMTNVVTLSKISTQAVVSFYAKQSQKCCPSISALSSEEVDVPEQLKSLLSKWRWKRHLAVYGSHALAQLWHQELGRAAWASFRFTPALLDRAKSVAAEAFPFVENDQAGVDNVQVCACECGAKRFLGDAKRFPQPSLVVSCAGGCRCRRFDGYGGG